MHLRQIKKEAILQPQIQRIQYFLIAQKKLATEMDRSQKPCKKMCIMCYHSPQNILVLACDHTVCLQCAYGAMTHRNSSSNNNNEIQFDCAKCHQVTYFDKDLIKQIEASIRPPNSKKYGQVKITKQQNIEKQKLLGGSFIEKMRNQYFSEKLSVKPTKNPETSPSFSIDYQKRISDQRDISLDSETKNQPKPRPSKQTRCKTHPYYELIYFCMDCRQVVCPQCLLRGQHKDHKNQSISQIIENQLPNFINHASQRFLKHVNQVQIHKQSQFEELNRKLLEIQSIRQNAEQYFMQVRKNLDKEERQVIEKCDQLLHDLRKEETHNQHRLKEIEFMLSKNIEEVKALKSYFKEFSSYDRCDTSRKSVEKSLIHKYLSCLKSVNSFFSTQQSLNPLEDCLQNEGQLLQKRIQEGVKSIRQSLVFESYLPKENKKEANEFQSRITTKLQPYNDKSGFLNKADPQAEYISYISTQNSQSKNEYKKQRQKSASISPYKASISIQKIHLRKSILPIKKSIFRETTEIGKENVLIQEKTGQSQLKTQLSTQNVSAKKSHNPKGQKTRHNSKEKSRNTSIAQSKKRHSIPYSNNAVNKFKL